MIEEEPFMKQFIVLCSTTILGIVIYNMILGSDDGSVINMISDVWKQGIEVRTSTP